MSIQKMIVDSDGLWTSSRNRERTTNKEHSLVNGSETVRTPVRCERARVSEGPCVVYYFSNWGHLIQVMFGKIMWKKLHHYLSLVILAAIAISLFIGLMHVKEYFDQKRILEHLQADSRAAEVLVTGSRYDETSQSVITTIKFLEYDVQNQPLAPKYFTFRGNRIQFQSLVVRFKDEVLEKNHPFEGKSVYLFLKAFVLDGANTQEFVISEVDEVPSGYKVPGTVGKAEEKIWSKFWEFVLSKDKKDAIGIKNAQIEAPGSIFLPGTLYVINIEHDGGLRIDTKPIPQILRGEKVL